MFPIRSRHRGYKLGAVDYVTVPIIPEILRGKVISAVELSQATHDHQHKSAESLAAANVALQAEKTRELELLNESLHIANDELGKRNAQLQTEVLDVTRGTGSAADRRGSAQERVSGDARA